MQFNIRYAFKIIKSNFYNHQLVFIALFPLVNSTCITYICISDVVLTFALKKSFK